jgi:hypothetical protein
VAPKLQERHQAEAGLLYSGADPRDLDQGVFGWDYVTYASYRYRPNTADQWRLRHQFWQYLDGNRRNVFDLSWRHRYSEQRALALAAGYLNSTDGYQLGSAYFGHQGPLGREGYFFAQGGLGTDSNTDLNGSLYLEALQPLTPKTLLRFREELFGCSSGYFYNTVRFNVIQALSRRVALNLGYRLFGNDEVSEKAADLVSHECSGALICQLRENLFLSTKYRCYWNSLDREAHSMAYEARWNPKKRLSLIGGYQWQHVPSGPLNHGFRLGASISF